MEKDPGSSDKQSGKTSMGRVHQQGQSKILKTTTELNPFDG